MKYIGGIALADTCMGNGELESIEMLKAGHIISQDCHPNYSEHLHLLGVGSINRMKPVIYLSKSGFLDKFQRISYDSTSHSSSLLFGKFMTGGKSGSIGLYRSYDSEQKLKLVYDFFQEFISKHATLEKFYYYTYGQEEPHIGKFTKTLITNRVKKGEIDDFVTSVAICFMYVYYQVHDFILQLDKEWSEPSDGHLLNLQKAKTLDELDHIVSQIRSKISSNRIVRAENISSLENFFI